MTDHIGVRNKSFDFVFEGIRNEEQRMVLVCLLLVGDMG